LPAVVIREVVRDRGGGKPLDDGNRHWRLADRE
jgi:hypothetical protein